MTNSPLKILIVVVAMLFGHGIAWSQCIVYNESSTQSFTGSSPTNPYKVQGFSLIGPRQEMADGLTRVPVASFYISTGKYKSNGRTVTYKDFYYYSDTPTNGNPSYGGLVVGLVKDGKTFRILATRSDTFDSDTLSGIATWKPLPGWGGGSTWYAPSLSGTFSYWEREDQSDSRPIGSAVNINIPVKVYKYSSSSSYVLNPNLTAGVSNLDFNQAFETAKQYFIGLGYTDRIAQPY